MATSRKELEKQYPGLGSATFIHCQQERAQSVPNNNLLSSGTRCEHLKGEFWARCDHSTFYAKGRPKPTTQTELRL